MIIDAHVHVTENGRWFDTDHDASVERLLASMSASKIDKAVLLPIAPFTSNKFIAGLCNEHPDKFIGFASVDPKDPDAVDNLAMSVDGLGSKGLKLHPRLQGFSLLEPNAVKIMERAMDLGIPVLIDAWVGHDSKLGSRLMDDLDKVATELTSAKLIIPHLGGHAYDRIPDMASDHQNLWFDLSFALTYFDDDIVSKDMLNIIKRIGSNRLIYGSDFPEVALEHSLARSQDILGRIFDREELGHIFSGTISRLLDI